jgi:uncharacterized membrane protein
VALLVTIHVLSAVIGLGPTFFFPALFRPALSPPELRGALAIGQRLARYPQVGGPVALLSGIGLVFAVDTHLFAQTWIRGTLVLFVVIQAIVMGVGVPATKRLGQWLSDPSNADAKALPPEVDAHYRRIRMVHAVAAVLGTGLFTLMILKPG